MENNQFREALAQEAQPFAHVFVHSDRAVFIHISRVFTCVSCVVLPRTLQIMSSLEAKYKRATVRINDNNLNYEIKVGFLRNTTV